MAHFLMHDNILCVLGGFEYSKPTLAISKQMALNLSEFIEEKRKENALVEKKDMGLASASPEKGNTGGE